MGISGKSAGMMAGGVVLVYSGARGFSILKAAQNLVQGKAANAGQTSTLISSGDGNTATNSETGVQSSAPPANASEKAWIVAMLTALAAPPTSANISSITDWISRETPWPPVAKNNPLNTTQESPGATAYNSAGVRNYTSPANGIIATVQTLENGNYPAIVSALRSGSGLAGSGPWNSELSTWSGGGYSSV
jgi:hypothetical protein